MPKGIRTPAAPVVAPCTLLLLFAASAAYPGNSAVPFESARWSFDGQHHRIERYLGRDAVFLHGAEAVLEDVSLLDGVLEVDIAFAADRGFSGVFWRRQGPGEREELYLRPHQTGQPDANQYTPVFRGMSAWQLYHGPAFSTPVDYRFDAWQHLRIVFVGGRAAVYLDSDEPILIVPQLERPPAPGAVGVYASNFAPAWFSNFRIRPIGPDDRIPAGGAERPQAEPGAVLSWEVSRPFSAETLDDSFRLPEHPNPGAWTTLASDAAGIANLSRVAARSPEADTVLARTRIRIAGEPARRRVRFGYSDDVRVYLDGKLLYQGTNGYRSRDYRFLGTIGLFDEVFLELGPGDHELTFAVTERFGGWGLMAVIEDG